MQIFDAVQCASCSAFQCQVRGATKKKWACVLCGERQSYVRIFASGAAKDLRPVVQQLNMARGTASEEAAALAMASAPSWQAEPSQLSAAGAWQWGGEPSGSADHWCGNGQAACGWGQSGVWPQPHDAVSAGWPGAPSAPPTADDDLYVTELPQRAPLRSKRKYGTGPNEFRNDPRRPLEFGQKAPTWMEMQAASGDAAMDGCARPPSRSFRHAPLPPRPAAPLGAPPMFVTAGASEVVDEEVWQG